MRTLVKCMVVAIVAGMSLSLSAQTQNQERRSPLVAGQDSVNDLSVAVGKSVLVDFEQPVRRVSVGLSDIAEVSVTSATEILLIGKTPGQTSLIVWSKSGERQFFNITVRNNTWETNDRLDAIRREIAEQLPGQSIKVSSENGSIFLSGTVKDVTSSERAAQIASTALVPIGTSDTTGKTSVGASGGSSPSGKVINLLYVDVPSAEKQILLKVRFASLDRSRQKQLGMNFVSLGTANTVGLVTTGQFTPPTVTNTSAGATASFSSNELNILALPVGNLPLGADVEALESTGVVQILAEPNLLASNGKEASFLAGGEYPYPVAQASTSGTTISIMFKEYGVRLTFLPRITPRGTIRLQVAPEVSSLDFTNGVTISGFEVPGISSRKVKTEVELADRQTFIVGGLLDNRETETFDKIPFIGDIPVLGKFFQSTNKSKSNTELIVIVTPELVDPIPANAPVPELKFPAPFLPKNSAAELHTPDARTGGNSPAVTTLPVETVVESQKREAEEKPLQVEGGFAPSGSTSR